LALKRKSGDLKIKYAAFVWNFAFEGDGYLFNCVETS